MKNTLPILVLALLLAGCLGPTQATETIPAEPTQRGSGAVAGRVVDDEIRPLEGIEVTIVELVETRSSDGNGTFRFDAVPEGNYTLVAAHPEFDDLDVRVEVAADELATVDLTMTRLPEFRPHNVTQPLRGQYDCAAEYLIITGHCGILVEYASCMLQSCQTDPVFAQAYQFPLEILPRWETLVAELRWTASASNGLGGMRMYVENTNVTEQAGHSVKVARAQGNEQPLYIRVDRGEIRPEAETYNGTNEQAFIPDEGGAQQIRVFPMGQGYDVTSQACLPGFGCFLGVGAGLGIEFEILVTVFYNERAPDGFSAASP